jgi:uncharacterized protein YprB with RNaseH-like and TPR domain
MEVDTLVIDTGDDIVGVYSVGDSQFKPYRGAAIVGALARIEDAAEVITYNGGRYDLEKLAKFARSIGVSFTLKGKHTDMREICWSPRILGTSLVDTFKQQFGRPPRRFPDTYEGNCECDVDMTYRLWYAWKEGTLRILDGHVG